MLTKTNTYRSPGAARLLVSVETMNNFMLPSTTDSGLNNKDNQKFNVSVLKLTIYATNWYIISYCRSNLHSQCIELFFTSFFSAFFPSRKLLFHSECWVFTQSNQLAPDFTRAGCSEPKTQFAFYNQIGVRLRFTLKKMYSSAKIKRFIKDYNELIF